MEAARNVQSVRPSKACVYCGVDAAGARLIPDGPGLWCCADDERCEARIQQQAGASEFGEIPAPKGPIAVAAGVSFPLEAAIARYVIFGKSGAGKTNSDCVLVEEFVRNGIPTIVVDAIGNMWGLRSSPSGLEPGLSIPILGGLHGDLPLSAGDGAALAEILGPGVSAVLDLSQLARDEQHYFAADFFGALLRYVGVPIHVVLEEGERWVPARSTSKAHFASSVAVSEWARQCRNETVGWTMSTQRVNHFSHDVLNANSALVAMLNSDEDEQRAIMAQVGSRAGRTKARKIVTTFATLKRGESWFLPDGAWLGDDDAEATATRFRFRLRSTWDAAQPKRIGEPRVVPSVRAEVDLSAFDGLSGAGDVAEPHDEGDEPEAEGAPTIAAAADGRHTILIELLRRHGLCERTPRPVVAALSGLSDYRFTAALEGLVDEGLVQTRRGRGGGVALTERGLSEL
ncbi:MAG: hypothetical protein ABSD03_16145, partial [Vulcanimicrobiaceae bacterium]